MRRKKTWDEIVEIHTSPHSISQAVKDVSAQLSAVIDDRARFCKWGAGNKRLQVSDEERDRRIALIESQFLDAKFSGDTAVFRYGLLVGCRT